MADPYVYPDTQVLQNRLDIRDAETLKQVERVSTAQRMMELLPKVALTYDGYKALHHHLFEEIYAWAGVPRSVNLIKGETLFAPPGRVDPSMEQRFSLIRQEKALRGLSPTRFAERAAEHISEINAIHPFREGNGRTQRAFLKVLAQQAGHVLDLSRIEPAPWNQASILGIALEYRPMAAVIASALVAPDAPHRDPLSPPSSTFRERCRARGGQEPSPEMAPRAPAAPDKDR